MSAQPAPQDAPARDPRFVVRERWRDCANLPDGDPRKTIEFLHRQMNEEVDALECSARSICDFPDAPWKMRLFLARQCSDEARHALLFRDLYVKRGGVLGQFPVMNFQYRIICAVDSLVARLAVQNRTFEAEGIDAIEFGIEKARSDGDEELADLFEAQLADEIQHVRVANDYIRASVAEQPRLLLRIGAALSSAADIFSEVFGEEGAAVDKYLPSRGPRLEAGFSEQEVECAIQLAQSRHSQIQGSTAVGD